VTWVLSAKAMFHQLTAASQFPDQMQESRSGQVRHTEAIRHAPVRSSGISAVDQVLSAKRGSVIGAGRAGAGCFPGRSARSAIPIMPTITMSQGFL